MMLGAIVDLGVAVEEIEEGLKGLPLGGFRLRAERVKRSGIMGTKVHVEVEENPHSHVHLGQILEKVRAASLPERVTQRAIAAYRELAEAEAHVHGSTPEKIHFHEVGANDAIVDIAGSMLGVELLGIESFSSDPVVVGNGTVKCAHGVMPVPAPATAEILRGFTMRSTDIDGELTTPTGAAILRVLAGSAHPPREFAATAIGYGAGGRTLEGHPNYLRLLVGSSESLGADLPVDREPVVMLETEIDDMAPELTGHLMETLFEAGARDVHFVPVQMKKNRPGISLRVLASPGKASDLARIILRETSTFGVRMNPSERFCLRRSPESVETALGSVEVKVGYWGDDILKVSPEYESCRSLARGSGKSLREVFDLARRAIEDKYFVQTPPEAEGAPDPTS